MGLFKALREILHAYRTFGDAEIQMLKKKIIENRELLIKVKEMQAAQAANVEQQMLSALKDTVHRMEDIQKQAQGDSESAESVLKSLGRMEEIRMKMEEKQKLAKLMSEVDIEKILKAGDIDDRPTKSPENVLQSDPDTKHA